MTSIEELREILKRKQDQLIEGKALMARYDMSDNNLVRDMNETIRALENQISIILKRIRELE
jgi:hypothetical protein